LGGWHLGDGVKENFEDLELLFFHFSFSYLAGTLCFLFINPLNQKELFAPIPQRELIVAVEAKAPIPSIL
jgi:hypothetical protein